MTNVGCHLGAWAWAIYAGSHIPSSDWGKLDLLRSSGVRTCEYLLYEGSPDTQFEDIRRLRQEREQQEIVLRLMHGNSLPSPAEHWGRYRARIAKALEVGYHVCVQPVNEPNLELKDSMTPAQLAEWFVAFEAAIDLPDIELVSPPIAPYADTSWAWWDGIRQAVAVSDSCGVHIYARDANALQGAYSLPWWLAQCPDKPLRVLECGSPTGTSAAAREAVLPALYGQLTKEARALGFYPFILSSEDAKHAEHWLTDADITTLRQCAQGIIPEVPVPPSDDSDGGSDDSSDDSDPFSGSWVLEFGDVRIPFVLRRGLL